METKITVQAEPVSKWATARLIIGIICIVLFPIVAFQSCAAGLGNALSGSEEGSGLAGTITAIFFLISGIVLVATRKTVKKGAPITCCVFLWIGFFLSRVLAGSYADLKVWGILAFIFGAISLISAMKSKKGIWISLAISALYFVLGII